ncbi:MAG: hypothetical protein QXP98_01960 [Thermoproteus sp.]
MPVVSWGEITPEELRRRRKEGPLLVVSHCAKSKNVDWAAVGEALRRAGLPTPGFDLELEGAYREALRDFVKPAAEMYGGSFKAVKALVESLRRCLDVDLYIVSARYGLIEAGRPVVPYEATLEGLGRAELEAWALSRGVPAKFAELLERNYGMIFAVLPGNYARALGPSLGALLSLENALLIIPTSLARRGAKALVVKNKGVLSRNADLARAKALLGEALCRQY